MTKSALWQQLATYPAQLDRQLIATIWPKGGQITGMAVTVSTGRVVNISPGSFVVPLGAGAGSALCISDAIETATFAAAPGSGSSRIDLLVVQVHDIALDSGGANGFTFDVVLGTASSTPAPPAVPARAMALAQVTSVGGQANLAQVNIAPQNQWDTGRVTPTFNGAWTGVTYRRTGNEVRLYGMFGGGASGSVAFVLPVGCRPLANAIFIAPNPVTSGVTGQINIDTAGNVTPTGNIGYGVWAEGITFTID